MANTCQYGRLYTVPNIYPPPPSPIKSHPTLKVKVGEDESPSQATQPIWMLFQPDKITKHYTANVSINTAKFIYKAMHRHWRLCTQWCVRKEALFKSWSSSETVFSGSFYPVLHTYVTCYFCDLSFSTALHSFRAGPSFKPMYFIIISLVSSSKALPSIS